MKSYRKTNLSLALGFALGSLGLYPAIGNATAVDMLSPILNMVKDSGGDSLLFPFYSTANGSSTSFSVTNTSGRAIAAKVRFREQTLSQDVRDFIVVLSPEDKFDFWVAQDVNTGKPAVFWNDNSCVVGAVEAPNQTKTLPLVDNIGDPAVGHVEVIGMLDVTNVYHQGQSLATAATHDANGIPVNCNTLDRAFSSRVDVNNLRDAANIPILESLGSHDVRNVLIGAYVVTAGANGVEGGDVPITVRNTFNRAVLAAQSAEACANPADGFNGVNQDTQNCYGLYAWDRQEEDHPHLGDVNWVKCYTDGPPALVCPSLAVLEPILPRPLPPLSEWDTSIVANLDAAWTANSLRGDWSNNPANQVGFDWIVTYPTKYVYLDDCNGDGVPAENVNLGDKVHGLLDKCKTPSPFGPGGVNNKAYCEANLRSPLDAYNTEEGIFVPPSPSNLYSYVSCNETNVFTFAMCPENGPCDPAVEPSLIQSAADREVRNFGYIPPNSVRGWIDQPLVWQKGVPTHQLPIGEGLPFNEFGAATHALLWLVRSTADPTVNDGSLRELERDMFSNAYK